MHKEQS